jgi:excinuclease ABC subunit B
MYADNITESMQKTISETTRRRKVQLEYNKTHGITPTSIKKEIREGIEAIKKAREIVQEAAGVGADTEDALDVISVLEREMEEAAKNLQFERAIQLRDQIRKIQKKFGTVKPLEK